VGRLNKTHEHYLKQKNQSFSYFKINSNDLDKLNNYQFTIYDFITNSFSFSQSKKELTIKILNLLKQKPTSFYDLLKELKAKKSSLYMVCISLEKSGIIFKNGVGSPYTLSNNFSQILKEYAKWWENWIK
jgi:predicted transcriptional regulator